MSPEARAAFWREVMAVAVAAAVAGIVPSAAQSEVSAPSAQPAQAHVVPHRGPLKRRKRKACRRETLTRLEALALEPPSKQRAVEAKWLRVRCENCRRCDVAPKPRI